MQLRKLSSRDEEVYWQYVESWGNEKMVPWSSYHNGQSYEAFLNSLSKAEVGTDRWVKYYRISKRKA